MANEAQKQYWTYSRNGEISDAEYKSIDQARERAEELVYDQNFGITGNGMPRNGDRAYGDFTFIRFFWDDETEERVILESVEEEVIAEYYHGDLAEHGTY